jgi:hypothetical protein
MDKFPEPIRNGFAEVDARDLALLNEAGNELNAEVEDILRYQDPEFWSSP